MELALQEALDAAIGIPVVDVDFTRRGLSGAPCARAHIIDPAVPRRRGILSPERAPSCSTPDCGTVGLEGATDHNKHALIVSPLWFSR
jgi:hypothetical protein